MKKQHMCPRNFDIRDTRKSAIEIYTSDKHKEHRTWYINGHIIFYCPYCGVDLKNIEPNE